MRYASSNYYQEEQQVYKVAYALSVRDEEVKAIGKKLWRHFAKKFPKERFPKEPGYIPAMPTIIIRGKSQSGSYCCRLNKIRVAHNPSMGLLIHECAHYLNRGGFFKTQLEKIENVGTDHHGLHFEICLSKCHQYAQSKGYWVKYLDKKKKKRIENICYALLFPKGIKFAKIVENNVQKVIDNMATV